MVWQQMTRAEETGKLSRESRRELDETMEA